MNKYVKTICLANEEPKENKVVLISGWGKTSEGGSNSDVLMKVIVSIISRQRCSIMYGSALITNQMFCAGGFGKGICQGDSGGTYIDSLYQFLIQKKYIILNC